MNLNVLHTKTCFTNGFKTVSPKSTGFTKENQHVLANIVDSPAQKKHKENKKINKQNPELCGNLMNHSCSLVKQTFPAEIYIRQKEHQYFCAQNLKNHK